MFMKYNYIKGVTVAAGLLLAASCTDFDDYNTAVVDELPAANQTVLQNLEQDPQQRFTNFVSLLKKSGFDSELNSSHMYTLWAPLDGTYDASVYQDLSVEDLRQQFILNHVADYIYRASGKIDNQKIEMLNKKKFVLSGNTSNYTFGELPLDSVNNANTNGLVHIIKGALEWRPNLYELAIDSVLQEGMNTDSLRNYFCRYHIMELDPSASVLGPINEQGLQTYSDSVMVLKNELSSYMNVKFDREDSTYSFIMPTNTAWTKAYNQIRSNYNYIRRIDAQAFTTDASGKKTLAAENDSVILKPEVLRDSLTRRMLVRGLVFNNNNPYNAWVEGTPSDKYGSDTILSTRNHKYSNGKDIMNYLQNKRKVSNGYIYTTDTLPFNIWECYVPEISLSPGGRNLAMSKNNKSVTKYVRNSSSEKDPDSYYYYESTSTKQELTFYLPEVKSHEYELFIVLFPSYATVDKQRVRRPNRFIAEMNYCDENGELKTHKFLQENPDSMQAFMDAFNVKDNTSNFDRIRAFSNNVTKIDTISLGRFAFPVCYSGLSDKKMICPNIKLSSPYSTANAAQKVAFTPDFRIAAIILKPVEQVADEDKNKQ